MREDERSAKSHAISENGKHSEIDEVPEEIELNGIIGRLSKKTLNVHRMQPKSKRSNETEVKLPNEEEMSGKKSPL